jgi:predicted GNAT family N-acyltransferase
VDAQEIAIRWASRPEDVPAAFVLREQVFCVEQGVPREEELDALDADALHLVALAPRRAPGARVIATLRLLLLEHEAKVGRVAVAADWRRRGIASRMLALAIERAREEGYARVRLAAQLTAVALYEAAGFSVESGEPFDDAGIPHVWMGLTLSP